MNVQRTFKKLAYSWNYHPDQVENSRSWPHIPSNQLISHPKGNHYPDPINTLVLLVFELFCV